jgi:fructokinase
MILCCGESLIDMLPRALETGENAFLPVAGGAVFNTAIALGRLGQKTGFFCGISSDMFGQLLAATLDASNVDHSLCPRPNLPTTLAFVTLSDGHAKYTFYDENSALRMLTTEDLPQLSALPGLKAAQFGCISLIGEPCASAYEALCARLAGHAVISLDPNIRPGFVKDEAAYRARLERMIAHADVIKVSDEDLAWLTRGGDFETAAKNWIAGGASIVVLTRGENGALAITRSGRVEVAAPKAKVVDTVGAGDTFNAGLLAGLDRAGLLDKAGLQGISDDDLRPALQLAAKVAAITVSRAGANPPFAHEIA